ncbi:hypothetical protein D3C80_1214890 [compost metagenome]
MTVRTSSIGSAMPAPEGSNSRMAVPLKICAATSNTCPDGRLTAKLSAGRDASLTRASALRSVWAASLPMMVSSRCPLISPATPSMPAVLAECRSTTLADALQANRQPCGWMLPGSWIGSRSQLVKLTVGCKVIGGPCGLPETGCLHDCRTFSGKRSVYSRFQALSLDCTLRFVIRGERRPAQGWPCWHDMRLELYTAIRNLPAQFCRGPGHALTGHGRV